MFLKLKEDYSLYKNSKNNTQYFTHPSLQTSISLEMLLRTVLVLFLCFNTSLQVRVLTSDDDIETWSNSGKIVKLASPDLQGKSYRII